jgi:PAS domain S-box-containing protein
VFYPPLELYQVLANLLGNAAKFAGREGQPPRVVVRWTLEGGLVTLRVSDNGPGVPPSFRDRVWGLFQKLDPKAEGTGVGLAIVKRIAERHGGRTWVEDSELGGAAFAVTMPPPRIPDRRRSKIAPTARPRLVILGADRMADPSTPPRQPAAGGSDDGRFRRLLEAMPQIVWAADGGGAVTYASRRWLDYTGTGLEDALGSGWADALHPEGREAVLGRWLEAVAADSAFEAEHRLRGHDGEYRWFAGRAEPLPGPDGRPSGWVGAWTDVHDRRLAEAERERARLQGLGWAARAAERTARLQGVTAALSRAVTLDEVAEVVVEQGLEAMGASAGGLMLRSPDGAAFEIARSVGYPPENVEAFRRVPYDSPLPPAVAARNGEAVWFEAPVPDPVEDPALAAARDRSPNRSAAIVPFAHGGSVGAMTLSFAGPRAFPEEDRAFMLALGRLCAQALERARLHDEVRRLNADLERRVEARTRELEARNATLEAFSALSRDLALETEPGRLVARAQEIALSLLPPGASTYYEPEGERWRLRSRRGELPDESPGGRRARLPARLVAEPRPAVGHGRAPLPGPLRRLDGRGAARGGAGHRRERGPAGGGGRRAPGRPGRGPLRPPRVVGRRARHARDGRERPGAGPRALAGRGGARPAKGRARGQERRAGDLHLHRLARPSPAAPQPARHGEPPPRGGGGRRRRRGRLSARAGREERGQDGRAAERPARPLQGRPGRGGGRGGGPGRGRRGGPRRPRGPPARPRSEGGAPERWPEVLYPRSALYQVLANLLGNAAKFAGREGAPPRVVVGWEAADGLVTVRVSDNGPGVPPSLRDKVWGLFQQMDPKAEGTGVGLAIVKRIAERHGGRAWVEDSPLAGAAFAVTMPVPTETSGAAPER